MLEDRNLLYHSIKVLASQYGFADFGCAPASEIPSGIKEHYLQALHKGYFAGMSYLHKNMEKRFNPQLLVEGAKSILVFLTPFSLPPNSTPPKGISQYALGKDYHIVIKEKLFRIMDFMKERNPEFKGRAFTDSAPVMEREWGVRAGLGFIGKNSFLISRKYGIKNFISVIICNLDIASTSEAEPQKIEENRGSCGKCTACLNHCPTGALCSPYTIDTRKCISYHTIENRELGKNMEEDILPDFGEQFFGCDACLDACPWNSRNTAGWDDFHTNSNILAKADFTWWENLSSEEFDRLFHNSALTRGGLSNIQTSIKWIKRRKQNGKL